LWLRTRIHYFSLKKKPKRVATHLNLFKKTYKYIIQLSF